MLCRCVVLAIRTACYITRHLHGFCCLQVAHAAAGAPASDPVSPKRAPSDAAAADASGEAAAAAAAAQAAKLHSVAKKQKDKIAVQKEEIAELRQQVGCQSGA